MSMTELSKLAGLSLAALVLAVAFALVTGTVTSMIFDDQPPKVAGFEIETS